MRAYLLIIEQRIRQWTNNSTKKLMISSYSTTKMVLGWPKMSSPSFWMILSKTSISQSRQNRCSTSSRSVTVMEMEGLRRKSWGSCIGSSQRDDWPTLCLEWKNIIDNFCWGIVAFSQRRLSKSLDWACWCWVLGFQCWLWFPGRGVRKGKHAAWPFRLPW